MPPIGHESIIGLPNYKITSYQGTKTVEITAEYTGVIGCIHCGSVNLRKKERFNRVFKHHSIGSAKSVLLIQTHKFYCRNCKKYFNQRMPGILPYQRSTEPFKDEVATKHHDGCSILKVSQRLTLGQATVGRYYKSYLLREFNEHKNASCPKILGIDEKKFSKKLGYQTTLVNLQKHTVFDITLGRTESNLGKYLRRMPDRSNCKVIVMDLSETYRKIARDYFPRAMVVADRFHVVRLVNHHFLKTWSELDVVGRKNRGLMYLMRMHEWTQMKDRSRRNLNRYLSENPALKAVYDFKQRLMKLILTRVSGVSQAKKVIPQFLDAIRALKTSKFKNLETLGDTLENWSEEIVRMWRFSKTNSITEGLHRRMDEIQNRAYGMHNFGNYRIRVKAYCG
jgi:transposase